MLLRIFKTSQPLSWILITFIIFVVRIALFGTLYSSNFTQTLANSPLWLVEFTNWSPWLSHILSSLIIISTGFFFNSITQNINIFKGIHYLLFLFFGLLTTFHPENLTVTPFILTLPLILLSTQIILTPSKEKVSLAAVFNAAIAIGLASLIYFPMMIYISLIWLSLTYLNKINWRQIVISAIGIYLPWLFHDVIILSFDFSFQTLSQIINSTFQGFDLANYTPINAVITFLGIIVFQLVNYFKVANHSIIKIRKTYIVLFIFFIIGTTLIGFLGYHYSQLINFIIIPASIIFTAFHLDIKKWWLSDLFFIFFLASIALSYLHI